MTARSVIGAGGSASDLRLRSVTNVWTNFVGGGENAEVWELVRALVVVTDGGGRSMYVMDGRVSGIREGRYGGGETP